MKTLADRVMDATAELLGYLRDRWSDEKDYEDFGDYGKAVADRLAAVPDATFLGMTKRPFGFRWLGADGFERHTKIRGAVVMTIRMERGK